jgi:hypothetical protein
VKKAFVFCLLLVLTVSQKSVAQSVPFNSQFAFSTNTKKTIWADLRFQTNSFFSSLNTEIAPMVNLKQTRNANYYAGLGVQFNPLNSLVNRAWLTGYFLSSGVRVRPFEKAKNVAIAFEISPYSAKKFDIGTFRTWLGVSYEF